MKKYFRLLTFSIAIITLFSSVVVTPAYAWPWSDRANVKVTVNPSGGPRPIDSINCDKDKATLSGGGRSYTASVSNPLGSNNCKFTFSDVYVGKGVTYTLSWSYTYSFSKSNKSTSLYVKRPLDATYNATVSYSP